MIFSAIISGLYRAWGIKRFILLFILLSLLVSSLVLNPYINTFQQYFSHRLAAEVLAQKNIYTYYLEFSHYLAPAVEAARSVISLGAFLFLIISVLLSGGVIDGLISPEPVRLRKFWSRSGHFFGRMSRLLILSSVILALALLLGILIPLPFSYLLPDAFVENTYFYFYAGWGLFIWLLFVIVFALVDLAKVLIVRDDRNSVLKAVHMAVRYTIRHPLQILFTYMTLYLVVCCSSYYTGGCNSLFPTPVPWASSGELLFFRFLFSCNTGLNFPVMERCTRRLRIWTLKL